MATTLFEKFGEFNSVEELNRAAAAQKTEGDEEALLLLGCENGIDKDDVMDYMDGATDKMATPLMAAVGKLNVEMEAYGIDGVLKEWTEEIIDLCTEDESFARAVRREGKSLAGFIACTADMGFENKVVVDKRIVALTKKIKSVIGSNEFSIGIPDKAQRRQIAIDYYMSRKEK